MLLENKKEQHPELNVYYAKNELEATINYERTFTPADSKKALNRYINATSTTLFTTKPKQELTEEELEAIKQRIMEYKNKIKEHYFNCGGALGKRCKILVTYDSFKHVKEALEEIGAMQRFQIVVDEFQSILVDVKFKTDTEMELLHHLSNLDRVCYVSATPMLDKYLKKLDDFKNLPYFQFDWTTEDPSRIIKPSLNLHRSDNVTNDIVKVVYTYKDGIFEKDCQLDEFGNIVEIESREAVIYVNSVRLICSIITKCELLPEQCNILIARTTENEQKVRRAFNTVYEKLGIKKILTKKTSIIGTIPTKGEPHKMFTFCTRTVYLGADFYSTCARSFIFCDSNIDCLSVDISMDLPQILGRQRLNENPWKNYADIYIRSTILKLTKADFDSTVAKKILSTKNLLDAYNEAQLKYKHDLAKAYEKSAVASNYKDDYLAVNHHGGKDLIPVFNQLMLVSEERAFDIQQMDYADRVSIFNTLKKKGFVYVDITNELNTFNSYGNYDLKMKCLCDFRGVISEEKFNLLLNSIPKSFKNYYLTLGPDKCKAHKYRKKDMEIEYQRLLNNQGVDMDARIYDTFHAGDRIRKKEIKEKLGKIYADSGYDSPARAIDLGNWFELKEIQFRVKGTNIRECGFELVKRINK